MWDIIQNIKGTDNQRNEVMIMGLDQPVSFFGRGSVFPLELLDIMNAKQGIMIVISMSESL